VAIVQKTILAKFGYIIDIQVGKKIESFFILGYLLEVMIRLWRFGIFFNLNFGEFGPLFSHEKSFV
jgi:hypothetical protein